MRRFSGRATVLDRVVRLVLVAMWVAGLVALGPGSARASGASIEDRQLEAELLDYLSVLDASYGVAVVNLNDGRSAFVNADAYFPTASMYKLLVMYRVFQAIDAGYLLPDDVVTIRADDFAGGDDAIFYPGDVVSVGHALDAMITASSNSAAYALTRTVGGWYAVASAADEMGMYSTVLDDDFWSTPADMAHFFRLLADRSLVSPWASEWMIDLLLAQTVDDRLPALLPYGVQVAHKTGELPGVRNDGGIVRTLDARYVIVVMSSGGDPDEQVLAEAELSRMVYDYFYEQSETARWLPPRGFQSPVSGARSRVHPSHSKCMGSGCSTQSPPQAKPASLNA